MRIQVYHPAPYKANLSPDYKAHNCRFCGKKGYAFWKKIKVCNDCYYELSLGFTPEKVKR